MATLHALHGLPGSGKTTFAMRLAEELPAVRFTPDEWMIALHGTNPPEALFRAQHPKIMELIWEHAARVLTAGADVILDVGFWSRASRDEVRARASALGVTLKLYFVKCPEQTARERVLRRTMERTPGSLLINEAAFEHFLLQFEPLAADETHLEVSG